MYDSSEVNNMNYLQLMEIFNKMEKRIVYVKLHVYLHHD